MDLEKSYLIGESLKLARKRDQLSKLNIRCPSCRTNQVQIISWFDRIKYKCRLCYKQWIYKDLDRMIR